MVNVHDAGRSLVHNDIKSLELYIRQKHPNEQQEIRRLILEDVTDGIYDRTPQPQNAIRPNPAAEKVSTHSNHVLCSILLQNTMYDSVLTLYHNSYTLYYQCMIENHMYSY